MPHYTVDYSQSGQAVILDELITPDTPRIVVDIGAHDGIEGSNSRALLEQGWRGVLVEPMPAIFPRLRENSAQFSNVSVIMAACAEKSGRATMRIGTDGDEGQMSSLSTHSLLRGNLSERSVEVETISVGDLFERERTFLKISAFCLSIQRAMIMRRCAA